jgi:hypothetical protein
MLIIVTFFAGGCIMFRKMKLFVAMLLVLGICTDAVLAVLIGYWPFDEGQGTEAADITGNGNDGALNGAVDWVPGFKGDGVHFDTAGERVVVGPLDPTAGTDAMTLAAWITGIPTTTTQLQSGSGKHSRTAIWCFETEERL